MNVYGNLNICVRDEDVMAKQKEIFLIKEKNELCAKNISPGKLNHTKWF